MRSVRVKWECMAVTATTPSRALRLRMATCSYQGPPRTISPSRLYFPIYRTVFNLEKRYSSNNESSGVIDEEAFETERMRLDAEAREAMAETFKNVMDAEESVVEDPKAWKWKIRKRVWDLMEAMNIAQNPRPVHHRIPNFIGAQAAAKKMADLDAFKQAKCVKVNPDSPQKQVRFLTLTGEKKLLTPQPRLRTGFFSILELQTIPPNAINEACMSVGVAKYGKPIGLNERLKVDLIVIGSVAVDPRTGARLGKGEGFAEIEYGMLRYMRAIDDSVLVVTSVHDQQLVDDIPVEKLLIHDVPVDIICTPTQVVLTNTKIPKPQGIYWDKLSPEKLSQICILRQLKTQIEHETGHKLPCGPSEKLPPTVTTCTYALLLASRRVKRFDGGSCRGQKQFIRPVGYRVEPKRASEIIR